MTNAKKLLAAGTLAVVLTAGAMVSGRKAGTLAGNFGGPPPVCSSDNPCPHK